MGQVILFFVLLAAIVALAGDIARRLSWVIRGTHRFDGINGIVPDTRSCARCGVRRDSHRWQPHACEAWQSR